MLVNIQAHFHWGRLLFLVLSSCSSLLPVLCRCNNKSQIRKLPRDCLIGISYTCEKNLNQTNLLWWKWLFHHCWSGFVCLMLRSQFCSPSLPPISVQNIYETKKIIIKLNQISPSEKTYQTNGSSKLSCKAHQYGGDVKIKARGNKGKSFLCAYA